MLYLCRGVEQLVARWAHNPKVAGSSPVPATKKRAFTLKLFFYFPRQIYQLFERYRSNNSYTKKTITIVIKGITIHQFLFSELYVLPKRGKITHNANNPISIETKHL